MVSLDKNSSYFLVEDPKGNFYRMPLVALGGIIVMNEEENDKVQNLIAAINELSTYILDLSTSFHEEHYSNEDLSTSFELLQETDALKIDKTILVEEDIEKYVHDRNIIEKARVDELYDDEADDASRVMDTVINEADSYF